MQDSQPMGTAFALILALAAALCACGADEASTAGVPVPGTRVGDTYQQVVAARGRPTSEMSGGTTRMLHYPGANIRYRDGVVVEVKGQADASVWRGRNIAESQAWANQPL